MASDQLSYYHGGPAPELPESLWEWLSGPGMKRPDAEALSALFEPASHLCHFTRSQAPASREYFSWTFRELVEAVEYVVGSFVQAGVKPGDVMAVFLNNSVEWVLLLWVSFRLGVNFATIDPSALGRPEELEYLLESLDPRIIATEDANAANIVDKVNDKHGRPVKARIVCDNGGQKNSYPSGWVSLPQLQPAEPSVSLPSTKSDPGAIAFTIFTSGTTSLPKGCPLTVHNIISEIMGYHSFRGGLWDSTSRTLLNNMCFRPLWYLNALNTWAGGGCTIIPSRVFDVDITLKAITSQCITNMMGVPSLVRSLATSPLLETHRPSTLRLFTCSGDTATAEIIAFAKEKLRVKHLLFHWGMSEGAPLFGWLGDEEVPTTAQGDIPAIGRPLPGTICRICDSSDGKTVVPRGNIGDMQVESASLIKNYLNLEHTKKAFSDEGERRWFSTGDLACMDESGAIYIVGRSKDVIMYKSSGIVPSIVEDHVEKHYNEETQVVGIPDPLCGSKAIVIVKGTHIKDSPEIRDEIEKSIPRTLGREYTMGGVFSLSDLGLSGWPKNSSDKIVKKDIVDEIITKRSVLGV